MNTELTQRRDELKRGKETTEHIIETQTLHLHNLEKELAELESQLSRPEPKYEVGQESAIISHDPEKWHWPISAVRFVDKWEYQLGQGDSWYPESWLVPMAPAPIPCTDEAEREFLLDVKAAREVGEELGWRILYTLYQIYAFAANEEAANKKKEHPFSGRLESKRPGALERLRK